MLKTYLKLWPSRTPTSHYYMVGNFDFSVTQNKNKKHQKGRDKTRKEVMTPPVLLSPSAHPSASLHSLPLFCWQRKDC